MTDRFVHEQGASRVVFGVGALDGAGDEVARLGARRVLLISDRHSAAHAEAVAGRLGGRVRGRITRTATHVPGESADAASREAAAHGADLLLCVGGGSATGLAKAVALRTGLRIVAVPTTYAGSEMTPIWGLTRDGRKETGRDPAVRPVTVIYDPALTTRLPGRLSAASGMNALAHLVEAAYAPRLSPLTAAVADQGIRVLAKALPRVVTDPEDMAARSDALQGAWLAGWVLGTTAMGLHHKLCHVLGGSYGLPHAATHSALLPYVTAFNRRAPRLGRVAEALGAADAATGLWELRTSIGAPASLAQPGFGTADIDRVAGLVAAEPPAGPRPVEPAGVRAILRAALDGARPVTTGDGDAP
ncbi:maleylacetate reductase [Actinomadura citrea]|uniref:Maleylacetate reductase n=1 Tax=Actinomadura citrea TaxID=46158 RepID=A0A7Y9KGF9_9ACTN|nr:maleylacetate reductase [Actinomadura citrea]NYE14679.1 maleylacetate reductase [Actinomadura citrea]GGT83663.1 maleylacetate reductase [Actinomadura citrea]